ncbi:MAG: hypothetical protein AAF215_04375 [Cyanobacteria bacterium P01_A01_bin.123]
MTEDYALGLALRRQAILHEPTLRSNRVYQHLGFIITMRRLLGRNTYSALSKLKRGFSDLVRLK